MSRISPALALGILVTVVGGSDGLAQTAASASDPGSPAPATTPAALAAKPQPSDFTDDTGAAPDTSRAVSSQTAARLTAGMPQYAPQKTPEPTVDGPSDAADEDKPKNGIIRLPDYIVTERPPPVFTKKELLTKDALIKTVYKEHPGLDFWGLMPLASLNAPIAEQMYDEEARLGNISDLKDTANSVGRGGDAGADKAIQAETQQTFMHDVWGSGDMDDGK